jgi:hypothetical protein
VAYTCSTLPVALKLGVDAELLVTVLVAIVSELTTRQALIVITTARAMRPAVELILFWVSWDTPTPSISFLWAAAQPVENVARAGQRGANRKEQRGADRKLAKLPDDESARDWQTVCRSVVLGAMAAQNLPTSNRSDRGSADDDRSDQLLRRARRRLVFPTRVRFIQDNSRSPDHNYPHQDRPMTQGERPT